MKYQESLMWQEINETPTALKNAAKNNSAVLDRLVEAVKKSNKTYFVLSARGTSDHAMMFFKNMLEIKTPYTAGQVSPSVVTLYGGKVNYKDCVFIGCSQSGMAEDVNECMTLARRQGAITVAITNNPNGLLARTAEYHLDCSAGAEKSVAATKTYSAQMYLALIFIAKLSGDKKLIERMNKLPDELARVMGDMDVLSNEFINPETLSMTEGFVLSRGITYSISFEQALKLQETSYKKIKGYASSDFYHGPMAMVDETTPIFCYCAKGMDDKVRETIFNDQKKSIENLLNMNAPMYIVTDDIEIVKNFNTRAHVVYVENKLGEELSIFYFALFAQMFACKISCLTGCCPDTPRRLAKVTVTR